MNLIRGYIVDIANKCFFPGEINFAEAIISIVPTFESVPDCYIFPGLVDSHVHIESSMLVPSEFSRLVVPRGTVAVVTDPHEIVNVMGEEGFNYMIEDSLLTPLKCFFGVPSCVPASDFDRSGFVLDSEVVSRLIARKEVCCLSEVMNYPGVLASDPVVMNKIHAAQRNGKPVDGHAPGLVGRDLMKYAQSGISTDHECSTIDEALFKISCGMKIQIREGSAARNFEALYSLISSHPSSVMLCTDDSHPDDLIERGHIDKIIAMGLKKGVSIFDLLQAAVVNPVLHYRLPVGLLRVGDPADMIVVDRLDEFHIVQTYINGTLIYDAGNIHLPKLPIAVVNHFEATFVDCIDVMLPHDKEAVRVIRVTDGELVTGDMKWIPQLSNNRLVFSSVDDDVLKIVVLNRYLKGEPPTVGFIHGFGLKKGGIGCSVAHDSHHLIVVGVSDDDILACMNLLIESRGGIAVVDGEKRDLLPLPIAGIMSDKSGEAVATKYRFLQRCASSLGSTLQSPFMTLSFMSLLVIPELKMSDRGLFNGNDFQFVDLFL